MFHKFILLGCDLCCDDSIAASNIIYWMSLLQQEQQGFFPSFPVVSSQPRSSSSLNEKPFDNEPHVVIQSPLQYKLPIEILQPITEIPRLPFTKQGADRSKRGSSLREQARLQTAYDKYVKSCQFQLIYSKGNKASLEAGEVHFARRPIDLTNLLKFNVNNYKSLKNYPNLEDLRGENRGVEQLCFGSDFQCGNLLYVYKSKRDYYTYDFIIENDTNTQGFNQWFYFSIKNLQRSVRYKFNIVNMTKRFSFYKGEMKPIIFSLQRHKRQQNGWYRRGYNVSYRSSDICLRQNERGRYYCLSFELDFDYQADFITISSGVPYSYSRLVKQLALYRSQAVNNNLSWSQRTICHTISCNQVPYLTITNESSEGNSKSQKKSKKSIIILLARQHPGETNSSFLMQKILQIISNNSNPKVQWLLSKYQFRIFPMINVDGVIYGNNRCDLAGFDLNRCWKKPIPQLHPHITAIKKQIASIHKTNQVICCIDFHSHSKQFNVFSYCNKQDQIESRLFAMILSKYTKIFHFPSCTFGLSREKQSTARAVIGSIISNYNVMTVQTSGYGFKSEDAVQCFKEKHFEDVANAIISALKSYYSPDKVRKNCLAEIRENLSKFRAYCRKNWEINSGSDSDSQSNMKSLEERLNKVLTHQLIEDIKKRFKQPININDPQPEPTQSHNLFEDDNYNDIFPRKEKMLKIILKNKKRSIISPQRKLLQLKKLPQNASETKKKANVPPQLHLVHNVRLNRISKKVKTQPRAQDLYQADKNQGNFRYHTPNRGSFMNQQQFKKSMKFLYKQLTYLHKEDYGFQRLQQAQPQLIVASNRQLTQRQKSNTGRLEKILKCRKKGSNFRISSMRDNQTIDEVTLLKIRSQHASISQGTIQRDLSPTANSKMQKLINHKQILKGAYGDHYLTHINFLNRFLRSNIRESVVEQ